MQIHHIMVNIARVLPEEYRAAKGQSATERAKERPESYLRNIEQLRDRGRGREVTKA